MLTQLLAQTRFSQMKKKLGLDDPAKPKSPTIRKPKGGETPSKVTKPAKTTGKKKGPAKPEPGPKTTVKREDGEKKSGLVKSEDVQDEDLLLVPTEEGGGFNWTGVDHTPYQIPF